MKDEILYKTYPRLFHLGLFLVATITFSSLAFIHLLSDKYLYSVIWLILASPFIFYLIQMKRIILRTNELIVSYLFLPLKKRYPLHEVKRITQNIGEVKMSLPSSVVGFSLSSSSDYSITEYNTTLELKNKQKVKFITMDSLDFQFIKSGLEKLKRGEGKVKKVDNLFMYIISNFFTAIFLFLMSFFAFGLVYSVATQQ